MRNCKQENSELIKKILNLGKSVYKNRVKSHPELIKRRLEGYDDYTIAYKDGVCLSIYKDEDEIGVIPYYVHIASAEETIYRTVKIRKITDNPEAEVFNYMGIAVVPLNEEKMKEVLKRAYDVLKAIAREEGVQEAVNN